MHPLGLTDDWADKLQGESFSDEAAGITYEHYMQVLQLYRSSSELYCFPAPAWHTPHAPCCIMADPCMSWHACCALYALCRTSPHCLPSALPCLQVVLTTIEPRNRPELQFDAYEYTVQSHKYNAGGWVPVG